MPGNKRSLSATSLKTTITRQANPNSSNQRPTVIAEARLFVAWSDSRCLDVRQATSSAFKDIKVGQVPKSRRCSSEPHKLSAAWAMRRPWRVFTRVFVAHGRKRSLNRNVVRSRPAAALAHQRDYGELTNKQKNWYRIRVFGDDRHRAICRAGRRYSKDIRRAYWFYAKVENRWCGS
jgi:hypothetical protein